jgi:hypothetical protein
MRFRQSCGVPSSYETRGRDAGKNLPAFDGVRVVRTLYAAA